MSTSCESDSDIDDCTMSVSDTRNTTNSLSRFTSEILTSYVYDVKTYLLFTEVRDGRLALHWHLGPRQHRLLLINSITQTFTLTVFSLYKRKLFMPWISGFLYKVWYRIFNSIRLLICCICKFINKKGKEIFLSISIRWASTILRRVHVLLYPRSEVWDPAVDSIFACQSTFVSKAVVPDENMLGASLVSERTSGVSLRCAVKILLRQV